MTKHTPGPWIARQYVSGHWEICEDATAKPLAKVEKSNPSNARLISACPEMLEALKEALKLWRDCRSLELAGVQFKSGPANKYYEKIRAAIAKAEGRE